MKDEISALLLHRPTESQRVLKQALEGRSINVNWLRYYREALPLLRGEDPPHLVFTEALLPDGTWADVVKLALEALKPVKVIVVSRLIDVRLYVETMAGGAFDFIVPPMTSDELAHILACAVESVLNLRRTPGHGGGRIARAVVAKTTNPPSALTGMKVALGSNL